MRVYDLSSNVVLQSWTVLILTFVDLENKELDFHVKSLAEIRKEKVQTTVVDKSSEYNTILSTFYLGIGKNFWVINQGYLIYITRLLCSWYVWLPNDFGYLSLADLLNENNSNKRLSCPDADISESKGKWSKKVDPCFHLFFTP